VRARGPRGGQRQVHPAGLRTRGLYARGGGPLPEARVRCRDTTGEPSSPARSSLLASGPFPLF
jgi:hypothetical protein